MYYEHLETDRAKLAQHNTALMAQARARLDKVAAKKKLKKQSKRESAA